MLNVKKLCCVTAVSCALVASVYAASSLVVNPSQVGPSTCRRVLTEPCRPSRHLTRYGRFQRNCLYVGIVAGGYYGDITRLYDQTNR